MNIHIYYTALALGGVETMLVRLCNWMVDHGHGVWIHLERHSELDAYLDPRVRLEIGRQHRVRTSYDLVDQAIEGSSEPATVVFSLDPESVMTALRRHRHRGEACRFLHGVYHPSSFMRVCTGRWYQRLQCSILLGHVAARSLVFMNEACRSRHRRDFSRGFEESMIVPTPLDDPGRRAATPIRHKIVSVGRLVAFKTYNLYMLDVVEELVRRGHDKVEWHVFGYGELRSRMESEIMSRSLGDRVFLHGAIEYAAFREVIADAGMFVGCGTAMVEAALAGVPCVVGVESSAGVTYGRFDHLDGFDVGERGEVPPTIPVVDAVESILNASGEEYRAIETASRLHGERFLIDGVGPLFVKSAMAAGPWRNPTLALAAIVRTHDALKAVSEGTRHARNRLVCSAKRWVPRPLQSVLRRINRLVPH